MTVGISQLSKYQFNENAIPLVGGKLFTYAAGTTNKLATYTDSTGLTPNANPVILDYNGQCDLWLTIGVFYKFVLAPATDTDPPTNPFWTEDYQSAAGSGTGTGTVTAVSIVATNGFAGAVTNPGTTPAITLSTPVSGLLKGSGGALTLATGADLPVMTATTGGAVPTPPNNSTTFLRGDGTFATPSATIGTSLYESFIATAGQTLFTTSFTYQVGIHALQVFVNGAHISSSDFAETSTSSFTLNMGVIVGDIVEALVVSGIGPAPVISGTSTTSTLIGTGSATFATQAGIVWSVGEWVILASAANTANYMTGPITAYSGTSLTVNVITVGGSGTHADWNISLSGVQGPPGTGTVTSASVVTANGFAGTVATPTTTPAITLTTSVTGVLKGNATAISAATSGTDYSAGTSALATGILKSTTATGALSIAAAGDFPTLNQNTSGTAAGLSATLSPTSGGTGVANNAASTITISGNFASTFIVSGAYSYTYPGLTTTLAGLGAVQSWTKAQIGAPVALTVSANAVAVDLSLANNFTLTLQATTSQVLSNPTNAVAGQSGSIYITQNATPSTLTFGTNWIEETTGTAATVSTTASAQNSLHYEVFDSTHVYYVLNRHGVA